MTTLQDWQKIHPDFNEELRKGWVKWFREKLNIKTNKWEKNENNAYQKVQDWIKAGLEPTESQFTKWLENKDYIPNEKRRNESEWEAEKQKLFPSTEKETLKQEYLNDKWALINPDFAEKDWRGITYQQHWEEADLTCQGAQEWIISGFKSKDFWSVKNWKIYNFTPREVKSWMDIGLTKSDAVFAAYLRFKNIQPSKSLNLKQLKKESKIYCILR